MQMDDLYKIALFSSLILIVPGPSNTLLLASGFKFGVLRSLPLVLIEMLGYTVSICTWGWGLVLLSQDHPWLIHLIKLACACYIAALALKTWKTSTSGTHQVERFDSWPRHLLIATVLNPKGLIFASVIFPAASFASLGSFVPSLSAFFLALAPIALLWVSLGAGIRAQYLGRVSGPLFSRGTAIVLALFSATLTYTVVRAV
ncbi:LysE family translocator [Pseudomonas piscis]|uniref:LysE family transporter n=1 Tax=Pseudomonas piscis TaxID=2614538 RepID=A0ABY9NPW1_9PSED|nr:MULTISPECIES: LysE family transporter [Pseudomonas]MCU7646201.1 LysE family transporter [Pseudomonas piscis]WMN20456.1 LysE family transporter [Pseudomonas piscis]